MVHTSSVASMQFSGQKYNVKVTRSRRSQTRNVP